MSNRIRINYIIVIKDYDIEDIDITNNVKTYIKVHTFHKINVIVN
jgi:hypothetical protein